jgi:hypothetical protein
MQRKEKAATRSKGDRCADATHTLPSRQGQGAHTRASCDAALCAVCALCGLCRVGGAQRGIAYSST